MDITKTGKGQMLYKKAKTLIPGGTQLLSKRPEMFLPEYWPAYYSKAKGCKIWDLDGNEYIDDGSLVAENVMFQTIYNFPAGFNENPELILITAG